MIRTSTDGVIEPKHSKIKLLGSSPSKTVLVELGHRVQVSRVKYVPSLFLLVKNVQCTFYILICGY